MCSQFPLDPLKLWRGLKLRLILKFNPFLTFLIHVWLKACNSWPDLCYVWNNKKITNTFLDHSGLQVCARTKLSISTHPFRMGGNTEFWGNPHLKDDKLVNSFPKHFKRHFTGFWLSFFPVLRTGKFKVEYQPITAQYNSSQAVGDRFFSPGLLHLKCITAYSAIFSN